VNKLLRDCAGSTLVEFTLVFPVFMLVAFGTVDVTYMLYDWALANKAAYAGAHRAIVSDPVATGITNLTYNATQIGNIGLSCFDSGTGALITDNCPSAQTICTPAAISGSCPGYTFNETAFTNGNGTGIFDRMQAIFPRLQRQNVTISYATNNLGFSGRPDGLPMEVTVSITGMTHQFFFLGPLMSFFGGTFAANPPIPSFATTLTSEDMVTN
jgi:hypothetical protein